MRQARYSLFLSVTLLASSMLPLNLPPLAPGTPDRAIYRRIEAVRAAAQGIQIDGLSGDWAGIPSVRKPRAAGACDPSRDIIEVAIAPREEDLLVLIVTAGRPCKTDYVFCLGIMFTGLAIPELRVDLSAHGQQRFYNPGTGDSFRGWDGAELAFGEVIEVRLPYREMAPMLSPGQASALVEGDYCPWMRVIVWPQDPTVAKPVGDSLAVASYRLMPMPFRLDQAAPPTERLPRRLTLPVKGQWYVGQGPFGSSTHAGHWAYDLFICDRGHEVWPASGNRIEDVYSWGQPVFAPERAKVVRTRNHSRDVGNPYEPPNVVCLDLEDGVGLSLVHLQKDSVSVALDEHVAPGQQLGRVGFSGDSTAPHLHLHMYQLPKEDATIPLALTNVRVSLNAGPDDYWARDLPIWMPRGGVFVERLEGVPRSAENRLAR
jgi:hypothetical protein